MNITVLYCFCRFLWRAGMRERERAMTIRERETLGWDLESSCGWLEKRIVNDYRKGVVSVSRGSTSFCFQVWDAKSKRRRKRRASVHFILGENTFFLSSLWRIKKFITLPCLPRVPWFFLSFVRLSVWVLPTFVASSLLLLFSLCATRLAPPISGRPKERV